MVDSPENIFTETPFFSYKSGKFGGAPTTIDSLEQVIKEEGQEIAPVVRIHRKNIWRERSLKHALIEAVRSASEEKYHSRQEALKKAYFKKNDGQAGKRSAQAIKDLIDQDCPSRSEIRPYIDDFKMQIANTTEARINLERQSLVGTDEISRIRKLPYIERIKAISDLFF
jgi:hypothetical protein